ncbi:MAG: cytidine deaminase [Sphingomonadales bacterium]|nr:cytidine deaminase [Sphingomonadales bacterium]MBK9002648.1 cytidine deaminase [Sphingomonadales bacterium]MBK9267869.1 cytidine deaminase [Sphingomonadales bacterium]MBP6433910.1 cytidine deaminase [Sphingorhabdus sp.]
MNDVSAKLVHAAIDAANNAYAPYSNFHVGAALLLDNGDIVTGANFENASYGITLCAETVAIAKANSDGQMRRIIAMAVAGGPKSGEGGAVIGAEPITPCGRCRQVIKEVADLVAIDLPVHCAHASGHETHLLSELLPHGFGPASLKS